MAVQNASLKWLGEGDPITFQVQYSEVAETPGMADGLILDIRALRT